MTKRLITEVAGVVTAPVEQVWQILVGDRPAHVMKTEIGEHTVAYQGGWWYRGEWSVTRHPEGTRVDHRVYSVAGPYWAVALANHLFIGFAERTRRSFAEGISRIADQLGCSARLT
ncbi:hypothetical protein EDD27_8994 [Nonomuraea polychroma]|uniref:Polyketide cyclase/dehydrase/lipid transport protein n=1 Tax=Nonomuraea polychroma TaxID=46176 RepID=A0A438MJN6_9ACTN|nr:hypothetical protein [Nonomuraea polychroma]RVX46142.1 hypothetical protein EDD27_8994 [Nonomuraea polychroma]